MTGFPGPEKMFAVSFHVSTFEVALTDLSHWDLSWDDHL